MYLRLVHILNWSMTELLVVVCIGAFNNSGNPCNLCTGFTGSGTYGGFKLTLRVLALITGGQLYGDQ